MGSWRYKKGNPEYDRYIHSAAWRIKADQRLEIDNRACQVCGKKATDVHHLAYDNFGHETMDDLVSLCRKCHEKAEELYDPKIIPWAMDEIKPDGNNFMAAMRADAAQIAPIVFEYLTETIGYSFDDLMRLRQPDDPERKKYWKPLKRAVNALCRKRYSVNCVEDRKDMMLNTILNHAELICLQKIEHLIRNNIQSDLHEMVLSYYAIFGTWKAVAENLNISTGTLQTLRKDDGASFGPSLREEVLHYCALDAAAGIPPIKGFECLTDRDYEVLNATADYMVSVSGIGAYRG